MSKEKEEDTRDNLNYEEEDFRICPECDGMGYVVYNEHIGKELCMVCDGLGVIYED